MKAVYCIGVLAAGLISAAYALADDLPVRPNATLTPGEALTRDASVVCVPGYARTVRHTSGKMKAEVYREYHLDRSAGHFEVDHLISLELGGADTMRNLWPESYDTAPWNARVKDRLEDRLHALVCKGALPLEQAQAEIAHDWIAAYQKYFDEP